MKMICKRCEKRILSDERAVSLKTFVGKNVLEEFFWHINCWTAFLEEKSLKRAEGMFSQAMKKGLSVAKNMMGGTPV